MAWLRRLLGMRSDDAEHAEGMNPADPSKVGPAGVEIRRSDHVRVEIHGGGIASVPQLDLIGQCATSPNGRFKLLWSDHRHVDGQVVTGRYVLIDGDRLVVDGRMARPHDGKIADDGVFILNDWGSTEKLAGTFHAFAADGRAVVMRSFAANLYNNGLSPDGRLAVSQTCSAPNSADSSVLCVFDLVVGEEIACWTPRSGWADGYEFTAGGDRIRMMRRGRAPLDYSLRGKFLDERTWFADEVRLGTLHVIREALRAGAEATGLTLNDLREGAGVAIADGDPRFRADALRLLGEIEERAGDPAAALAAYRGALEANPKIGVAKRAAALAKSFDWPPA